MSQRGILPNTEDAKAIRIYFDNIADSKPLSKERETELAKKIKDGDVQARDELVMANLRFVVDVATQYQHRGLPLTDLISSGNLGLIEAAERFDGTKGFKFISYAVWYIRQAILQTIAENARTVRLPLNKLALLKDISKTSRRLSKGKEKTPDIEEIAAELDISAKEIQETLLSSRTVRSLDELVEEGDARTLGELLSDPTQEDPEAIATRLSSSEQLARTMKGLKKQEQYVIRRYFGLDEEKPSTLEEIGLDLHRSRERIRQIRDDAIEKIRRRLEKEDKVINKNKNARERWPIIRADSTVQALATALKSSLASDLIAHLRLPEYAEDLGAAFSDKGVRATNEILGLLRINLHALESIQDELAPIPIQPPHEERKERMPSQPKKQKVMYWASFATRPSIAKLKFPSEEDFLARIATEGGDIAKVLRDRKFEVSGAQGYAPGQTVALVKKFLDTKGIAYTTHSRNGKMAKPVLPKKEQAQEETHQATSTTQNLASGINAICAIQQRLQQIDKLSAEIKDILAGKNIKP